MPRHARLIEDDAAGGGSQSSSGHLPRWQGQAMPSIGDHQHGSSCRSWDRADAARVIVRQVNGQERGERQSSIAATRGVTLLIGSDHAETSLAEVQHLSTLHLFDNRTLLKMWCEATPAAIFPSGESESCRGYEASFLALPGIRIEDFDQVRAIRRRIQTGVPLDGAPDAGRCLVSSGPEESVMRGVQPALRQHSGNWSGQKLECTMERNGWRGSVVGS